MVQDDDPELQELAAKIYWGLGMARRKWEAVGDILRRDYEIKGGRRRAKYLAEQWEVRGRVDHVVMSRDLSGKIPPRNPQLEKEVLQRFNLRHIMVIGADDEKPNTDSVTKEKIEREIEQDNWIHQCLGTWASSLLLAYLRPNDVLGAGPGRGPYYTAQSAENRAGKGQPTLKSIVSLCGSMSQSKPEHRIIDADQVAGALRNIPLYAAHVFFVNCSIVPDARRENAPSTHLEKRSWPKFRPDVALIGIGSMAGGHRMLAIQDSDFDFRGALPDFRSVLALASQIDGHIRRIEPFYHCVGDLCNHLFPVPLPADTDQLLKKKLEPEFKKLTASIEQFNKCTYTARPAQLQQVAQGGAVIAVAGGWHKHHAIKHVLSQTETWVTHLVTDNATAQWLIQQTKRP